MDDTPEQEISPGIFVTDFRTAASRAATQQQQQQHTEQKQQPPQHHEPNPTEQKQSTSHSTHPTQQHSDLSDLNQLSFDLHQLTNSIDHLIASNAEMVTAMEEDAAAGKDEDDEYASAIRENMQLIDRKQSEAAELQALIDSMLAGHALDRGSGSESGAGQAPSSSASSSASSAAGNSSSGQADGDGDGIYL